MKTLAPAEDASSNPARKRTKTRPAARRRTLENTYTDPGLRERLKNEIRAAAKGGEPGTWSARKSQLLTLAYQKSGGGYVQRHPNAKPKDLQDWTSQDLQASGAKPATRSTRYPLKKAWPVLPPTEAKATGGKKKLTTNLGAHAASSTDAKRARKQAD